MNEGIPSVSRAALRRVRHAMRRGIGRIGAIGFGVAIAIGVNLSFAPGAAAATINTYTFTQDAYVSTVGAPTTATLHGTFTGHVDENGWMTLPGLTSFEMEVNVDLVGPIDLTATIDWLPSYFFFDTLSSPNASGGNSTLGVTVWLTLTGPENVCIGSPAAFNCLTSLANGAIPALALKTLAFPRLTLVSSTAVTPIPAAFLMFGTALAGLGLFGAKARRLRAQA